MKDSERLDEIRGHLERYQRAVLWDLEREAELADLYTRYSEDIPFLLAKVSDLEWDYAQLRRESEGEG